MRCPGNSIAHRDCCIGVSFPLVALEKYPDWRKKPARLIEAQKALMEIQGLLEVGALTAGERRDMQAACEAAADALFYGGSWKKRPELWLKVKHIISLTSDRLYLHHQAEAEEAARIWHCHASPRKNPGMEDIWTD